MCHDERFLNLWIKELPFSLDIIADLPCYVLNNSFQTMWDDKSGYDHVRLSPDSRTYFSPQWNGWFFVFNTLPFGWKASAYLYHFVSLISTGYIRFRGVPCSQYIDIHHFGELQIWRTAPPCSRSGFQPAQAALYIACYILIDLGYFIGLEKSTLLPTQMPIFLGYIVDFPKTAFLMPSIIRLSSLFLEKVCSATKRYLLSPFRSCWKDKLLYTCRPCRQVVFFSGMFGHVKAL